MARIVRCPQCGDDAVWGPENPFRPFCSERCKLIDLGCWASESYRISGQQDPEDPAAPPVGQS